MLQILSRAGGVCQMCMKEQLIYSCRYKDGLRGSFCQEHMFDLLDKRLAQEEQQHAAKTKA